MKPMTEWAQKKKILLHDDRLITELHQDTNKDHTFALAVSLPRKDAFLDCLIKLCTTEPQLTPESWINGPEYR